MSRKKAQAQKELRRLYDRIEAQVAPLEEQHKKRLLCKRGCSRCCVDELTVWPVEADHIRAHAPEVLRQEPGPEGACAFLDQAGACRIYAWRPYVCRTQGLPLRWVEEDEDGDWLEYRDICPLNEEGEPIESLPEEACWTLGPTEGDLAQIQQRCYNHPGPREPLRTLFQKPEP